MLYMSVQKSSGSFLTRRAIAGEAERVVTLFIFSLVYNLYFCLINVQQ